MQERLNRFHRGDLQAEEITHDRQERQVRQLPDRKNTSLFPSP